MTREKTEEFTLPGRTCLPISLTGDSRTRFAIFPEVVNIDPLPPLSTSYSSFFCYYCGLV